MIVRTWRLAHERQIETGRKSLLMGILNVTPDSFSDGGAHIAQTDAMRAAEQMIADGADIIDVGGESTRPGAMPISPATELARVAPTVEALARLGTSLISVDTYRAATADAAIRAGAHIVNDVWGLRRDPELAAVISDAPAGVVIMHTNRERETTLAPLDDQIAYFEQSLEIARRAGISEDAIALDPGLGFGKESVDANLAVIAGLERLERLGFPILVGASRKRFLGAITGRDIHQRDVATAAANVAMRLAGASIFRVHDIPANRDALAVADAVVAHRQGGEA